MNAKELLEDVRDSLWAVKTIEGTIAELDDIIGASAIRYDADKVSSSPQKDGLEKLAIEHLGRVEAVKKELLQMVSHYAEIKKIALYFISKLESDSQKEVLEMRYIKGMKWWEILEARQCDDLRNQQRLCDRAIEALQEIIDNIEQ